MPPAAHPPVLHLPFSEGLSSEPAIRWQKPRNKSEQLQRQDPGRLGSAAGHHREALGRAGLLQEPGAAVVSQRTWRFCCNSCSSSLRPPPPPSPSQPTARPAPTRPAPGPSPTPCTPRWCSRAPSRLSAGRRVHAPAPGASCTLAPRWGWPGPSPSRSRPAARDRAPGTAAQRTPTPPEIAPPRPPASQTGSAQAGGAPPTDAGPGLQLRARQRVAANPLLGHRSALDHRRTPDPGPAPWTSCSTKASR